MKKGDKETLEKLQKASRDGLTTRAKGVVDYMLGGFADGRISPGYCQIKLRNCGKFTAREVADWLRSNGVVTECDSCKKKCPVLENDGTMSKQDENRCKALKLACAEWMRAYDQAYGLENIIKRSRCSSPAHTALLIHLRSVVDDWKSFVFLMTGFDYTFVEDLEGAMKDSFTFTPVDALLKKHGYMKQ